MLLRHVSNPEAMAALDCFLFLLLSNSAACSYVAQRNASQISRITPPARALTRTAESLVLSSVKSSAPQAQTASGMAGKSPSSSAIRQFWNRRTTTAVAFAIVLLSCWTLGPASIQELKTAALQYSNQRPGAGQTVQPGGAFAAAPEVSGYKEDVDFPGSFEGNVALLMEEDPMAISNFASVLLHFRGMLGPHWEVVILTRKGWKIPDSQVLRQHLSDGRIRVRFLPDGVSFPTHPSVSVFLTDPWLWETFEKVNRILMFQADSILCSNSKARVDDFLEWDFVGAPVLPAYVDSKRPNARSFNGGLSIRNPRIFAEIARDPSLNFTADLTSGPYKELPNNMRFEDHWFMWRIDERPDLEARIPPPEVAGQFSVETWYFDQPLGYHQPHRWQAERYSEIVDWCPEVGIIFNQEAPDQRWN